MFIFHVEQGIFEQSRARYFARSAKACSSTITAAVTQCGTYIIQSLRDDTLHNVYTKA